MGQAPTCSSFGADRSPIIQFADYSMDVPGAPELQHLSDAVRATQDSASQEPAVGASTSSTTKQEAANPAPAPTPLLLHMPVDIRSLALAVLAVLATLFALHWARAIVVPLLLGLMVSYALTPIVNRLVLWRIPRAAAAALVLTSIVGALGWGSWSLRNEANNFVDALPAISQKVRHLLAGSANTPAGTIAKVQQAAAEISKAAEEGVGAVSSSVDVAATGPAPSAGGPVKGKTAVAATQPAVARVVIERPSWDVRSYLWTGTIGLLIFFSEMALVVLVAFFLLASGNAFRRKMVKLAGPKLSQKKVTVEALDEVTSQMQRYLLIQILISVFVGVLTWLAFLWLGMDNAGVWGVVAGATNLIPYIGAVLVGFSSAVMALVQFGSVEPALIVGGSSFAIHAIMGNVVGPWLTGRANRMSPLAVFVAVIFFGWLWGPVGLILGVPLVLVAKAVCERVDELKPVGEFLGP
ncbi:MAG: AI-2E family transporter [Burkholderiaceae bacterium]